MDTLENQSGSDSAVRSKTPPQHASSWPVKRPQASPEERDTWEEQPENHELHRPPTLKMQLKTEVRSHLWPKWVRTP